MNKKHLIYLLKRPFRREFWIPSTRADWFAIGFVTGFVVTLVWLWIISLLL